MSKPVQTPSKVTEQLLSAEVLKESFAQFPSGLTIVTASSPWGPIGFTCQAFYSVSLEPPLVSISVMKGTSTFPEIRKVGKFAVNVLSQGQSDVAMQFARKDGDRWNGVDWVVGDNGAPVLIESVTSFECEHWAEYEAGDHTIVLGKISAIHNSGTSTEPLVYHRSAFRQLTSS